VTNTNLATGSIWRLHHGDQEIVRLVVTEADFPWMYADVETLAGFEAFRQVFAAQEDDDDQIDACYQRIRSQLTMTYPCGDPVPEFMLHIHDDGTASWRWHYEPFEEEDG
jgi:hypothetical protein